MDEKKPEGQKPTIVIEFTGPDSLIFKQGMTNVHMHQILVAADWLQRIAAAQIEATLRGPGGVLYRPIVVPGRGLRSHSH